MTHPGFLASPTPRFPSPGLGFPGPNFISGLSPGGAVGCSVPEPLSSLEKRVLTT